MGGELVSALTQAAAEAMGARTAELCKEIANCRGENPYVGDRFERAVVRAAVAAVLETLAGAAFPWTRDRLERLAAEVRGEDT